MMSRFAMVSFGAMLFLAGCGTDPAANLATQSADAQLGAQSKAGIHQASLLLGKQLFSKMDKDGDGFIEQGEWLAAGQSAAEFKTLDVSKEGRLSLTDLMSAKVFSDFSTQVVTVTGKLVGQLDTNRDGVVSRAEFQAGLAQGKVDPGKMGLSMTAFDLADTHLDGYLTPSEMQNLIAFSVVESVLNAPAPAPAPNPPATGSVQAKFASY